MTRRQVRSSSRQQRQRQAYRRVCANAAWESTAVSLLFEGQMSYLTVCMHCDHQTHSTQTFTVLSLPIPTDHNKCTIQVMLWAAGTLCTTSMQTLFQMSSHTLSALPVSVLHRTVCHCSSNRLSWLGGSRCCAQCVGWGEKLQSSPLWINHPRSSHYIWNGGYRCITNSPGIINTAFMTPS